MNFFEEGDYEISLDYTIRRAWINMESLLFWDVDIHTLPSHRNYRINFKFSVRNGNCMISLRDVRTQEELTTYAPNGFYLDLTKSRYLDINVKKEVLESNSDKLDVRFNKPAKDGDQYTEKGVYTITLKNRYTKEVTTKGISVGDDPILNAYASTLMPIGKIKKQLQNAKNSKNQINISLKDASNNIKLKVKVKPHKSDLKPDNSKQQNESVNISLPITNQESISDIKDATNNTDSFQKTDDSDLSQKLASIEKEVSEQLSKNLGDHKVEKVEAIYLSQEYIEELQYNSLANEYFGYSFRDLEKQFEGEKYVFTLDKDNKTVIRSLKNLNEDIWGKVIKDVAIGSGVILITATVSLVTGGTATVALVTAAKAGIEWAVYGAFIDSALAGIITGIQTKNFDKTVKSMVVAGAEGFKWGAIAGVVIGGVSKAWELRKAAKLASSEKVRELIKRGLEFQKYVHKKLGGKLEPIYYKGKEISTAVKGCSKPGIVRNVNGRLEAIETKSYDLDKGISGLISKLRSQVAERVQNLPEGSLQRIIIDKRKYSKELLDEVRKKNTGRFNGCL
ncbi:MAG: hypothetical protein K5780_03740 [Alphaproteobacteria bacterium]|nr:hypothetical protein [Alphaproteobacteria bacterium]